MIFEIWNVEKLQQVTEEVNSTGEGISSGSLKLKRKVKML